jgi:hypothetical protein
MLLRKIRHICTYIWLDYSMRAQERVGVFHRISWYLHVQYTRMNVTFTWQKNAAVIRSIHPTLLMITFYTFAFWINI